MERFNNTLTQLFNGEKMVLLDSFNKALGAKNKDIDTYMAIAEQHLTFIEADKVDAKFVNSSLSAYDLLKTELLLGEHGNFLVINGSLSGIQDFLFDTTSKEALKQLRGRSFFLSILIDTVAEALLAEFDLSRQALLYNSGGTFCMVIPQSSSEDIDKFNTIAKKIKDVVFSQFGKQLILLNAVSATKEQITTDLPSVLNKLQALKVKDKHTPLCDSLSNDSNSFFKPYTPQNSSPLDNDMPNIGSHLGQTKYCFVSREGIKCGIVSIKPIEALNITYNLLSEVQDIRKYKGKDGYIIAYNDNPLPNGIPCRREYIAGVGSETRSFQMLNASWLAVLRMDVDNLGVTMRDSFTGINPLASYSKMSRQLDIYFKHNLNKMWLEGGYNLSIVIVYSGGDDLFLVGEWSKIVEFAQKINDESRAFFGYKLKEENGQLVKCEAITISAGIALTDIKYPIIRTAEMGADEESKAKRFIFGQNSKNAISIFGTALRWDVEFKKIMNIFNNFNQLLNSKNENTRRGVKVMVRRILNYAEIARFKERQIYPIRLIWLITYDMTRSVKRYKECKEIIEICRNDITSGNTILREPISSPYHSLELWAIAARLIEVKNRNNNIGNE